MAARKPRNLKFKGMSPLSIGSPANDDEETFYISDENGQFIINAFSRNQMREIIRLLDPHVQRAFASKKRVGKEGIVWQNASRKIDFGFNIDDEQGQKGEFFLTLCGMETTPGEVGDSRCDDFELTDISFRNWNIFVAWI